MATARVIRPEFEEDLSQTITIDSTLTPSPQACIVSSAQQVVFTNNSGQTINIQFESIKTPTAPTVFNNVQNLSPTAPNNTNTQTPQVNNQTVNYQIQVGNNNPVGPFAIQVGNGPFYIEVTWDSTHSVGMCDPGSVMIPPNGTLQAYSGDQTSYNVGWLPSDPFTTPLTSISPGIVGPNTHQVSPNIVSGSSFTYTVGKVSPADEKGSGGGTVKLG